MKKYQHYIDVRGEVLPTPRRTTTAVVTSKFVMGYIYYDGVFCSKTSSKGLAPINEVKRINFVHCYQECAQHGK